MYVYTISSIPKYDIGNGLERLIYVGSCKDYERRFISHRSDYLNEKLRGYNRKAYRFLRQFGIENFTFEIVEVLDDDTTDQELLLREQFYIEKFDSKKSMNTHDAIIIDKVEYMRLHSADFYKQNTDKCNKKCSEWYKKHRTETLEKQKMYRFKKKLWKNAITDLSAIDVSCFE